MFACPLGLKRIVNLLFEYPDVKLLHEYPMDSENIKLVLLATYNISQIYSHKLS